MKQVTVNGNTYLAAGMTNGEDGLTVAQALQVNGQVTKNDVARYMKAENLDELKDITFGGAGVAYSEVALDKDIEFAIKVAGLVMDEAKATAVDKLVNREFDGGLGAASAQTATSDVWNTN